MFSAIRMACRRVWQVGMLCALPIAGSSLVGCSAAQARFVDSPPVLSALVPLASRAPRYAFAMQEVAPDAEAGHLVAVQAPRPVQGKGTPAVGIRAGTGVNPELWRTLDEGKDAIAAAKKQMDGLAPDVMQATQSIVKALASIGGKKVTDEARRELLSQGVAAIARVGDALAKAIATESSVRAGFERSAQKLRDLRADLEQQKAKATEGIAAAGKVLQETEAERRALQAKLAALRGKGGDVELEQKLDKLYDRYRDWTRTVEHQKELRALFGRVAREFRAELAPLRENRDRLVELYHDMRDVSAKLTVVARQMRSEVDLQEIRRVGKDVVQLVTACRRVQFAGFFGRVRQALHTIEKGDQASHAASRITKREAWKRGGPTVSLPAEAGEVARVGR